MSKYRHINGSPTTERMMTRSGRGSYLEHDDGVQIECEIIKIYPRSIVVWDGSEIPHPILKGKRIKREVNIGESLINDGEFDIEAHSVGDQIKIMIPNWLALKEGLI